jgi:hypothetical protein
MLTFGIVWLMDCIKIITNYLHDNRVLYMATQFILIQLSICDCGFHCKNYDIILNIVIWNS